MLQSLISVNGIMDDQSILDKPEDAEYSNGTDLYICTKMDLKAVFLTRGYLHWFAGAASCAYMTVSPTGSLNQVREFPSLVETCMCFGTPICPILRSNHYILFDC